MFLCKKTLAAFVCAAFLLASCGGSGGGAAGAVSSKVTVVDGYISGATVFLDKNKNGKRDINGINGYTGVTEPVAVPTTVAGEYTFVGISAATLSLYPVVVQVTPGAIDSDNPNQPITKMFNMTAPAGGSGVVSPMTTLIDSQMKNNPGMTITQAQTGIKKVMGLPSNSTVDLMADYVAQGNTKVHQVAQVVAAVVGSNQAKLQNAKSGKASTATLVDVLVQKALAKLPTIVLKVDTAAANFNLATTASLIGAGAGFQINVSKLNQQLANQHAKLQKPKITLKGASVETFVAATGATYVDSGATAASNKYGDISASIMATGVGAVNLTAVGIYKVAYNVADAAGNKASPVTRTVNVIAAVDTTPPTINLIGGAVILQAGTTPYVEQGAVSIDNEDGDISAKIAITGAVNAAVPKTYTLIYNVSDNAGNAAPAVTRTVTVTQAVDTTPPVLTLNYPDVTGFVAGYIVTDPAVMTVVQNSTFTDPGASAVDLVDGNLTANILKSGTYVNTASIGQFTIIYDAFDKALVPNAAISVTRIINVIAAPDTTKPVISLTGATPVTVNQGAVYTDLGATASDKVDGNITANITVVNPVDTAVPGIYSVTYDVVDAAKNTAVQLIRTVRVTAFADATAPTIRLLGLPTVTVVQKTVYTDAGATAFDSVDGALIPTATSTVNTANVGNYTVTYNVLDAAANAATAVTRNVKVIANPALIDNQPPVITMQGLPVVVIEFGSVYTDAGATAFDLKDGTLTAVVVNNVNTAALGVYAVTYNISDLAGNAATQLTRAVNVVDTTAPAVTAPAAVTMEATAATTAVTLGTAIVTDAVTAGLAATATPAGPYAVGVHTIIWSATDAAGNVGTATQTVTVTDTTVPVVTAPAAITLEATGATTVVTLGTATVADVVTAGLTATASPAGPYSVGATTVTWTSIADAAGLTGTATQIVTVTDLTAPAIAVNGSTAINVASGSVYTDAGATAADIVDGTVTVITTGTVNTATIGAVNTLTYTATDAAGNASTATRTVTIVAESIPPVVTAPAAVTFEATALLTTVPLGTATVIDNVSTGLTATATPAGPYGVGVHTITWSATDAAGNIGTATQTVTVTDTTVPVVTAPVAITLEATGATTPVVLGTATVADLVTAGLTATATPAGPYAVGVHTITWSATDAAGNIGTATQTVTVTDFTAPAITLTGSAAINVTSGSVYTDAGATAMDIVDGAVTVVTTGTVNTATNGNYTLTYTATDAAGNASTATRAVTVVTGVANPGILSSYITAGKSIDFLDQPDVNVYAYGDVSWGGVNATALTFNNFVWNAATNTFGAAPAQVNIQYRLQANGTWTAVNTELATYVDNGVAGMVATNSDGSTETLTLGTVTDLVGLNIKSTLASQTTSAGPHWSAIVNPTAVFTAGAQNVSIINTQNQAVYQVGQWTYPGCTPLGFTQNCNVASYWDNVGNTNVNPTVLGQVLSINGTLTPQGNGTLQLYKDLFFIGDNTSSYSISLMANATTDTTGSARIYKNTNGSNYGAYNWNQIDPATGNPALNTPFAITTWNSVVVNGTTVIEIAIPASIAPVQFGGPALSKVGFAVQDGFVRPVDVTLAGASGSMDQLNSVAMADVKANIGANFDTVKPVIQLNGQPVMNVALNGTFIEPGSVVTDNVSTGLTATVTGAVNTAVAATYTLTYNATDGAGNAAVAVTRTVVVSGGPDTVPPVITLNGLATMTVTQNTTFTDPGSVVTDNVSTGLTAVVTGAVNTAALGTYTLTYTATDVAGNTATVVRTVNVTVAVADTILPVITLNGLATMIVAQNSTFTDPGSVVTDNVSTGLIATVTGAVTTATVGTYTLTYNATDGAANAAVAVTRTVNVVSAGTVVANPGILSSYITAGKSIDFLNQPDVNVYAYGDVSWGGVNATAITFNNFVWNAATNTFGPAPAQTNIQYRLQANGTWAAVNTDLATYVDNGVAGMVATNSDGSTETLTLGTVTDLVGLNIKSTLASQTTSAGPHWSAIVNPAAVFTAGAQNVSIISTQNQAVYQVGQWTYPGCTPLGVTQNCNVANYWDHAGNANVNPTVLSQVLSINGSTLPQGNGTLQLYKDLFFIGDNTSQYSVSLMANATTDTTGSARIYKNTAPFNYGAYNWNQFDPATGNPALNTPFAITTWNSVVVNGTTVIEIAIPASIALAQSGGPALSKVGFAVQDNFVRQVDVILAGASSMDQLNSVAMADVKANIGANFDAVKPVIQLNGQPVMNVALNGTFIEPGSVVTDNVSTGLTVTVTGAVNTAVAATYTLTYNATDGAGNAAVPVTRTVVVQ